MAKVAFRFLDRAQVTALMPPHAELVDIVAAGLAAHGRRDVVMPPKAHIDLDSRYNGHFNVLVGWAGHIDRAGVKVTGDYVDNWRHGLPSEVALVTLYDPHRGVPLAILDATHITAWRTGAVTAAGARHLAPENPRVLGHIGARGSAFPNLALLASQYAFDEVRIHSKRAESRERLAQRARSELGLNAIAVDSVEQCVRGAQIVVEATRLEAPELLLRDEWLEPGCLLVTYGWKMVVDPRTVLSAGKVVVDDWAQCTKGGQLQPMIESGQLTRERVHAEIGEVVAGLRPGRTSADERIVFWHRGFAISDIVVGHAVLARAEAADVGTMLTLFDMPDE
ncbi:MAG: ornithine cyclodeaminase family protein [Burkholderiales bacterium]